MAMPSAGPPAIAPVMAPEPRRPEPGAASSAGSARTAIQRWSCGAAEGVAIAPPEPPSENRPWKISWLASTDRLTRQSERVRPASPTQTMPAKARDSATGTRPGPDPPPRVCESAATKVENRAAIQPRANRAHRVVIVAPSARSLPPYPAPDGGQAGRRAGGTAGSRAGIRPGSAAAR